MPTPFMHLDVAERIRTLLVGQPNGRLLHLLNQQWPAFYLGSIAADVSSVANIPREATHFYTMPPALDWQAHQEMFRQYPHLANVAGLLADQAIFIAAYSAHLMLDLVWFHHIVMPFFARSSAWGSRESRRLAHFILLAYLDREALAALPATAVGTLAAAQSQQWLPFVDDSHLATWQTMLVEQLKPGAPIQTVAVYAQRLHMLPQTFAANLDNPQWLEEQLFNRVPVAEIKAIIATAVPRSIDLITNYLQLD